MSKIAKRQSRGNTDWNKRWTAPESKPFAGLPKRCECGGKMIYSQGAGGYVGSCCDRCTPVVRVSLERQGGKQQ